MHNTTNTRPLEVDQARLLPHLRTRTITKPTRCTRCRRQSTTLICQACERDLNNDQAA